MWGRQALESDHAEGWTDMTADVVSITLLGPGRCVSSDIGVQPFLHELGNSLAGPGQVAALLNLSKPITGSLFPSSLVDLDQDGSLEIIAIETRWETYEHLPHPVAPTVEETFAWSNGSYRRASQEYPHYYQQKINHIESLMDQIELPYDYLGNSIKLLLNYDRMGQTKRGWEEFERLLQTESPSIVGTDVWQSIKDPILEDFKIELGQHD